jgi:hypothetical protein
MGQLHNLYSALIVDQDKSAPTAGLVNDLTLMGMRKLSQQVFALFKQTYIDARRNFFTDLNDVPDQEFLGEAPLKRDGQTSGDAQSEGNSASLAQHVSAARSRVRAFVIYQLSNSLPPGGSSVGCGHYDERGCGDGGGIAKRMNDYAFGVCFNPDINEDNVLQFLDHCLTHLSSSFFSGGDEEGYFASKARLPGGLDPKEMGRYWSQRREFIRDRVLHVEDRCVVTLNYTASYRDHLAGVFAVLDELADDSVSDEAESNKPQPHSS